MRLNPERDWRPCEKKPILKKSDWFYPFFENGIVFDKMARVVLSRQIAKIARLECEKFDGKKYYFCSHTNGADNYLREKRAKMICAVKTLLETHSSVFFLTLTYDKNASSKNRLEAWANYHKEIAPLLTALRKQFGARHVGVLESTKKGFPHAHVVLFFENGTFPELDKLKPRTTIKFGRLKDFVKTRAVAPVFHLEKGDVNKALSYVLKYIGKTGESDYRKLLHSDKDWTDVQRKDVFSFIFPIIAGVRRVFYSESREIAKRMEMYREEKEFISKYRENESDYSDAIGEKISEKDFIPDPDPLSVVYGVKKWCEILSVPALRERVLIKLCTNVAPILTKSVRGVSLKKYELEFLDGEEESEKLPSEIREYFNKNARAFYGAHSFFERFLKLDGLISAPAFETPYSDLAWRVSANDSRKIRALEKWAAAHWTPFDYEFQEIMAPPEMAENYGKMQIFTENISNRRNWKRNRKLSMPERLDHLQTLERLAALPGATENQKWHAFLWRQDFERRKSYCSLTYIHACLDEEE